MYLVRAMNEHGKDEAEVEFVVLGPPGPPEGPLEVVDVHKEGCKIRWKPPKDDGGRPIQKYILEKLDTDTGKWSPCGETDGDKLELELNNLETGKKVKFRVKARKLGGFCPHSTNLWCGRSGFFLRCQRFHLVRRA